MSGIEKASVLLMTLGPDASEQILSKLKPEERDVLNAQIARMRSGGGSGEDRAEVRSRVLDEVRDAMHGPRPSGGVPFRWLESKDPVEIAGMLAGERPRTIALVLSYLLPGVVASVMGRFDEKTRDRVAHALAEGSPASDDVVRTIDEAMQARSEGRAAKPRPNEVLSILGALGGATAKARESLLSAFSKTHFAAGASPQQPVANDSVAPGGGSPQTDSGSETAAPTRRSALSSLEDLARLPDWRTRALLGGADLDDLCLALRVASDDLKATILRNIPTVTATLLQERLGKTAQVKIREVEIAQRRVLAAVASAYDSQGDGSLE